MHERASRDHGDTSNSHFYLLSRVFTYTLYYLLIHRESSVSITWNEIGESHWSFGGALRSYTNWEDREKVWHHIFSKEFRVDPAAHPFLCTEDPHATKWNRERMAELMFETLSVPSFYVGIQSVLSLLGTGRQKLMPKLNAAYTIAQREIIVDSQTA